MPKCKTCGKTKPSYQMKEENLNYKKACEEALNSLEEEYKKGERNMIKKIIKKIKERVWVWNEENFTKRERREFDRIIKFRYELTNELRKLNRGGKK